MRTEWSTRLVGAVGNAREGVWFGYGDRSGLKHRLTARLNAEKKWFCVPSNARESAIANGESPQGLRDQILIIQP